ncbi:hypothetical protein LguiB_007037 [Lonicera macranthoides]
MEDDGDWVMVQRPTDKDLWNPSSLLGIGGGPSQASKPLKVSFIDGPAQHWTDALPIGNGRLGAMVWGGVVSETLNLNDAPKALPKVRELIDDGKYADATIAAEDLQGAHTDVYQLLGDMKLEFDGFHAAYGEETYRRELDLDTAMVKVKYSVGEVEFVREHFSSNPDQVIVTKISGSKSESLSFTLYLTSELNYTSHVNGRNQIIMEGSCPGKRIPRKANEDDNPKGIQFSAVLDLQISNGSGEIQISDGNKLKVEGADWAVILLVASSSFDGPFTKPSDSKRDPTSESLSSMNSIRNLSYSQLYARHLDDYQKLFHRVSLQLSKSPINIAEDGSSVYMEASENERVSTAERVISFETDEDPSLVELLFQYGRYLLISCSRPDTQAANLQGIWNKDIEPKWDAAPHLNINLQMNYWPSLPCSLSECQEPLFDHISFLSINGSKTAKVNYEASGWVVHHVSDIWAKSNPDRGRGGYLETNPSTSPEHPFIAPDGRSASVSYSSTMDMAIIREVFSAVVYAAKVLGKSEDDLVKRVCEAQPRLYPTKIARDGSIMEWALDFEDPAVQHRHLSHLFGLFPGHTITAEETPDLCKAAEKSLYKRGEDGPGWSTTWKTACWARLHNSEHAYRMVKHLITLVDPDHEVAFEGGLYANLFAAHPPFQIDANLGFCAAVAEMLVQSSMKDLYLLPALPHDKWPNGCVKGLKARGGVTVSIWWNDEDLHEVGVWSINSNSFERLHYRGTIVEVKISPGRIYTFNKQLKCIKSCTLETASL